MTDKILIDGWNLAWKIPQVAQYIPGDLERARLNLNILLKNHFQGRRVRFKVIYDGRPGIRQIKGYDRSVDTAFSHDPEKADHLIVAFIRSQRNPARWTVITSDRELAGRVKNLGATVIDSGSFIAKIDRSGPEMPELPSKTHPELQPEELAFWLKTFKKR